MGHVIIVGHKNLEFVQVPSEHLVMVLSSQVVSSVGIKHCFLSLRQEPSLHNIPYISGQ